MRDRPSTSDLLAWAVVGVGAGLLAGFAAAHWLGPVDASRVRRTVSRLAREKPEPAPLKAADAVRSVRHALSRDEAFRGLELDALAVGPGTVELHGWVPSRALRARAGRIVSGLAGIESVVNCLLVEGEDDLGGPAPVANDQPA